jgi:glucokinase
MHVLGIDIGGTKSMVGVAEPSGELLAWKRIETPNSLGPDTNLAAIIAATREVIGESCASISVVGIGCGGPLDRKSGTLHRISNLPGWEGLCLTRIFSEEFGAPAYLDNDATAAAMGEAMFGAGRGVDCFAYFTISTGIGGGIIIDGKPYRGCGENAGEFGHAKILPDGPRCNCGDRGCLEALASGTAIARIARDGIERGAISILSGWVSSPEQVTAELVGRAASVGDSFAGEVWSRAMYHLGIGIANAVNVLNPRLVILGGGVTRAGDLLFRPVREVVNERAMKALAADVRIVPAANGDLVGLMGAFAVAMEGVSYCQQG